MDRIFANTIRHFREEAKLSQEEAAEMAGITQSQVSRLEGGSSWPNPMTVRRLCKAFGISTWDFFRRMGQDMLSVPRENWIELDEDDI